MVSTLRKTADSSEDGEHVFLAAHSEYDRYELRKNVVVNSNNYVANYVFSYYPVT